MKEKSELRKNTLVATVMSNLGLRLAMEEQGITMLETKVGDRYVWRSSTPVTTAWVASSPVTSSCRCTAPPVTAP